MVIGQSEYYISPEEYLEGEKFSEIKHEYIDGQIYAMAGASDAHVIGSVAKKPNSDLIFQRLPS